MTAIGEFRHLITVEKPQRGAPDAYGHRAEDGWLTIGRVWAKVETISSQEGVQDEQPRWTTKYRFWLREYVAGLTQACRVVWGSRTLYVEEAHDADDHGRLGVRWQLVCVERG